MKKLEMIFKVQSMVAMAGWVMLIALPFWPAGRELVTPLVIILLSALYVYLLLFGKHLDEPGIHPRGSFMTLRGVMNLFQHPRAVLTGWVHYLAFDLMVGLFIVSDGYLVGIDHLWLVPCLLATLMFGPAGLLLYLVMRIALTSEFSLLLS